MAGIRCIGVGWWIWQSVDRIDGLRCGRTRGEGAWTCRGKQTVLTPLETRHLFQRGCLPAASNTRAPSNVGARKGLLHKLLRTVRGGSKHSHLGGNPHIRDFFAQTADARSRRPPLQSAYVANLQAAKSIQLPGARRSIRSTARHSMPHPSQTVPAPRTITD